MEPERRLTNNAFARAAFGRTQPLGPLGRALLALLQVPLALMLLGAMFLPPVVAVYMVARGFSQRRWGMVAAGLLVVLLLLVPLGRAVARKLRRAPRVP